MTTFSDEPKKGRKEKKIKPCLGIDGEGFNSGSVYSYMAAATADGVVEGTAETISGTGLSTAQCLEFLLDLPRTPLKIGFSLGYDHTHWLKDLSNKSLYRLTHMEERQRRHGPPEPVFFVDPKGLHEGKYSINLLSGKLTIIKYVGHTPECIQVGVTCAGCVFKKRVIIWDFFKFFQSSFISACLSWKVISKEEFEILKKMKAGRSEFKRPKNENDEAWVEVKEYCKLECAKLARLGDLLVQAHEDAGLKLKAFYGAGSTSGAMLDKMNARRFSRRLLLHKVTGAPIKGRGGLPLTTAATGPEEMLSALSCAFFGGRFETSWIGPWEKPCWSYDISSAYPYAFTFLPCMIHGKWERIRFGRNNRAGVQARIEKATTAIVRYELPWCHAVGKVKDEASHAPYGPFPFRNTDGNILFPVMSGGGWVWKEEFLAAQASFPNVKPLEAWVYECDCACTVLRNTMPSNYKLRLEWGKEGKGIVSKLGQNGCYGKCAQTKGANPPYQNFVWAGMTTASCRAQVLRAGAGHWDQILMVATDGIVSRERLYLETPKDTGTFDALNDKGQLANKPLGGWEEKELPKGIHVIRPGIAFPLTPIEESEEKESKARGVGKAIMFKLRGEVLEHWFAHGTKDLKLKRPMFHGMRSQIRRPSSKSEGKHIRGKLYGRFSDQEVKVSYFAQPKRPCADGRKLMTWAFSMDKISCPYKPILGEEAVMSDMIKELREEKRMMEDQPDAADDWDEGL